MVWKRLYIIQPLYPYYPVILVIVIRRQTDHQHLLSIPTRRSSDLPPATRTTPAPARDPSSPASGAPEGARPTAPPRDRKSTRLNSSHSQISYAVFCLKKNTLSNLFTLITLLS